MPLLTTSRGSYELLERDGFRLRQQPRSITSPSPRSSRGEGWGEGLLPQIPNIGVRGDPPHPDCFAIRPCVRKIWQNVRTGGCQPTARSLELSPYRPKAIEPEGERGT